MNTLTHLQKDSFRQISTIEILKQLNMQKHLILASLLAERTSQMVSSFHKRVIKMITEAIFNMILQTQKGLWKIRVSRM